MNRTPEGVPPRPACVGMAGNPGRWMEWSRGPESRGRTVRDHTIESDFGGIRMEQGKAPIEVTLLGGSAGPASGEGDFFAMVEAGLTGMLEVCWAQAGMVRLFEGWPGEEFERVRFRRWETGDSEAVRRDASALVQQVRIDGKAVVESPSVSLLDETRDDLEAGESLQARPKAALCVPIRVRGTIRGVVYLEREGAGFTNEALSVLRWFAQLIEVELGRRRHPWRWKTLNVSHHLRSTVVA